MHTSLDALRHGPHAIPHQAPPAESDPTGSTDDVEALRRSQLRHDIQHELSTIILLATVVSTADDIGPASRLRIEQLRGESLWLRRLLRAYRDAEDNCTEPGPERVRVDAVAGSVVDALRLATATTVTLRADEAWAHADLLTLWRAVRNVVENAVRVAGPGGTVHVSVATEGDWAVTQVDDDGPGFGAAPSGIASLGLGIVQDFVSGYGGTVQIRPSELGGGCVRILLRAAHTARAAWAPKGDEDDEAAAL